MAPWGTPKMIPPPKELPDRPCTTGERLTAGNTNHARRVPAADDLVEPLMGGTPQKVPMPEGQVVIVSPVKDMGTVKERRAVLISWVKARRIVACRVLYRSNLVQGFRIRIVQVKLHAVPATIVQRHEPGIVVGIVPVRAYEHVENV